MADGQDVIVGEIFVMFICYFALQIYYFFVYGCNYFSIQSESRMKLEQVYFGLCRQSPSTHFRRNWEME